MISVIIPTYNEEGTIGALLKQLVALSGIEVIVVDGGSQDTTVAIARDYPVAVLLTAQGRAHQINEGAGASRGEGLLFLHADCCLQEGALLRIKMAFALGFVGGCFSQRIDSSSVIYRAIEASGNIRAKVFKIFYGDQAIFVRRDIFFDIGGFDHLPLFDDVVFSRKLKRAGKTCVLPEYVYVSPRRWEQQGVARTTFRNWLLTIGFGMGISPEKLKTFYSEVR